MDSGELRQPESISALTAFLAAMHNHFGTVGFVFFNFKFNINSHGCHLLPVSK